MRAKIIAISLAFLSLPTALSCGSVSSQAIASRPKSSPRGPQQAITDKTLMALAKKFAVEPENEEAVLQELGRHPRLEILERLTKLQEASREETRASFSIAFLLCNLDYDVENNKRAVVEAFKRDLHSRHPDSEWEACVLDRLMKKGHKDLLPVLFDAVEYSDGALSQSLSGFLLEQLRDEPQDFLVQLNRQSKSVRQLVYSFLAYAEIAPEELNKTIRYLNSVSDFNLDQTRREILVAIQQPPPKPL
jgi:hypothetical protein